MYVFDVFFKTLGTNLARELWAEILMTIEGGSDVEADRVIILHAGDAGLEDMAYLPELGAFIHVLIKPLFAHGQVKFLDKKSQLGME